MSWRAAKETFVATRRVGVGPGVKMELKRLVMKSAMVADFFAGFVMYLLTTAKCFGSCKGARGVVRACCSAS